MLTPWLHNLYEKPVIQWLVLTLVLLTFIGYHLFLLLGYHTVFTDLDQTLLWEGAMDMWSGNFYEPKFYGQTHIVLVESFMAVPLLMAGLSPDWALPLVTLVMGVFPFLLLAWLEYRRSGTRGALLVMIVPLLLTMHYDFLLGLPRGFVGGICCASLVLVPLYRYSERTLFIGTLCAAIGAVLTPNSVVLSVPVLAAIWWPRRKEFRPYVIVLIAVLPGLAWEAWSQYFYSTNSWFPVWPEMDMGWSIEQWLASLATLDLQFGHLMPLAWGMGWLVPVCFLAAGWAFRRSDPGLAWLAFVATLILIVSIGLNKTHDGFDNVFLSIARFYLAIPLLLAVLGARLLSRSTIAVSVALIAMVFVVPYKMVNAKGEWEAQTMGAAGLPVMPVSVAVLENECNTLDSIAQQHDAELIITGYGPMQDQLSRCYGCRALTGSEFLMVHHADRRTWVMQYISDQRYDHILYRVVYDSLALSEITELGFDAQVVSEDPLLVLVSGNDIDPIQLFESHHLRRFK